MEEIVCVRSFCGIYFNDLVIKIYEICGIYFCDSIVPKTFAEFVLEIDNDIAENLENISNVVLIG